MPQASDEDRERMTRWFGSISDYGPTKFLEAHGYVVQKGWIWKRPVPSHLVSEAEWYCIKFLIDEWDWGSVEKAPDDTPNLPPHTPVDDGWPKEAA